MNLGAPPTKTPTLEQWTLTSTLDLLDVIWRRKFLMGLGMLIGVLAGLAYFYLSTPLYESSAEVLLVDKRLDAGTKDPAYASGFEDYLATHRALIVSPMIIERASRTHNLDQLRTFTGAKQSEGLWEWIREQVYVTAGPRELGENADTIMTLAFQGTDAEEAPQVVNAILDSYKSFLDEIYVEKTDNSLRLIGEARDLLENDLQRHEDAYIEFRQTSPLVTRGADEINPRQDRLASIEAQRSELLIRETQIEGQLQSLMLAQEQQADGETLLALVTDLRSQNDADNARSSVSSALDNQLIQLADRKRELLQRYGPNHPHVAAVNERIAATRRMLAAPTSAYIGSEDANEANTMVSIVEQAETYQQYLEQELERVRTSARLLGELYDKEHERAKELSGYQLRDERFRRDRDRLVQLYSTVATQLKDADMARDYGGFEARIIGKPLEGERVHPRGRIAVAGGGILGSFLGLCLALLAEWRDKSFRSRNDIQSRLGLTVLTQVPHFKPKTPSPAGDATVALDASLCTFYDPHSVESEAFRRMRTSLLFGPRGIPKVLQVSGPSPDDGASTVAANLSISIAQLDRRVLLIDTDVHRPKQHQLFGIPAERGLSCVLQRHESLEDATYRTDVDGLWLLGAGPNPLANQDAYSSKRFADLLEEARQNYDVVIIDTEPVLAVSDPCVIGSQVDAVILALRPTRDSRWRSLRAKGLLDTVNVTPLGIVVNNVGGTGARNYRDKSGDYDVSYWQNNNDSTSDVSR